MNRKSEEIKEKQISEVMASIENRVRHAYNQGYEQGLKASKQEPCEDAISRQAVLDAIDVKAWEFCDYLISKNRNDEQKPVSHFADNLRECVREELPSVKQQEPKTGHWILTDDDFVYCSECEDSYYPRPIDASWCYCPHCGARMEV